MQQARRENTGTGRRPNVMLIVMDDMGYCIDLLPTIVDLAGLARGDIPLAEGAPAWPGRSLVPAFERDGAVTRDPIYFHHQGNRALRVGNWKIVSAADNVVRRMEGDTWCLYDLARDRCEMVDLGRGRPEKLAEMQAAWEACEDGYRTVAT